jgi:two-component system, chemotaxis family, protein-glutamate methylesterase/glutaminase
MAERNIVVIGGSVGGVKAMRGILAELHGTIPAAIFLVLHTSVQSPGLLPELLTLPGSLSVRYAQNGEPFERGLIYVAPADYHMLVEAGGVIRLAFGPKENRFRPAVDPLFRSAALAFGPRVAGVVLSGGLDDGTAGLVAIKAAGGVAIVQDPLEAEAPSMPHSALRHVRVDHCLPVREIAGLLIRLSSGGGSRATPPKQGRAMPDKDLEIEVQIASENRGHLPDVLELGAPSLFTCPECHGTLLRLDDEKMLRFRCHTGHAFTASSLRAALSGRTEEALWNALRAIEESAMLLEHMAAHVPPPDDAAVAEDFRLASEAELRRAQALRALIPSRLPALPDEGERAVEPATTPPPATPANRRPALRRRAHRNR